MVLAQKQLSRPTRRDSILELQWEYCIEQGEMWTICAASDTDSEKHLKNQVHPRPMVHLFYSLPRKRLRVGELARERVRETWNRNSGKTAFILINIFLTLLQQLLL